MSKKTQLMEEIRMLLAMFASDIRAEHASIQGDVHSKSEEVVAYLLHAMYDYSFPGGGRMDLNRSMIDLYDEEADGGMGVAVQVTRSNTRQKAIHTIRLTAIKKPPSTSRSCGSCILSSAGSSRCLP